MRVRGRGAQFVRRDRHSGTLAVVWSLDRFAYTVGGLEKESNHRTSTKYSYQMRIPDKMLEDILEYGVIAAWQPFQQLLQLQQFHVSILQKMLKIIPCKSDIKEISDGPTAFISGYF
jgi:hypothetical protein